MKREYLLYGAVIVLFGGVVLWATEAPWQAVAIAAGIALGLLLAAALLVRPSPTVLLVGATSNGQLELLSETLRRDGFDVEVCPGPQDSACPVLAGKPCPAHGRPVAAVVVRHPDDAQGLAPCGEAFRIPELAVEEGSDREPEIAGRYGRVGMDRGPEAVSDTLNRLLTRA
jgi:hypothetical protein